MITDDRLAHWRPVLLRYCAAYLDRAGAAEDVAQEVCLQAAALEDWPTRAWLFQTARHRCLNALRGERRRPDGKRLTTGTDRAKSAAGPLTRLVQKEDAAQVAALVERLSPAQREALLLRYAHGLGRAEIAEVVGETPSVIKSRLCEGLARLRALADSAEDAG